MSFGRLWDGLWPQDEDPPGGLARRALEHLPHTAVVAFDRDLRFLLVAGPAVNEAGLHRSAIEGLRLEEVVPSPAAETLSRLYRRALAGEHVSLRYRSSLNGRMLWLNLAPLRDADGDVRAGIAVTVDLTALGELAPAAEADGGEARDGGEDEFRTAFAGAPVALALVDSDGRLHQVNAAFCQLTGRSATELVGTPLAGIAHPDDLHHELAPLRELAEDVHHGELRLLHREGHLVRASLRAALLPAGGEGGRRVLLHLLDASVRRPLEEQDPFLTDHDPLTSLPNRRGLERELMAHIARSRRYGAEGAVLALDLDRFQAVNEAHGHRAADEVLTQVAELLRSALRESDFLAHAGGDEFFVLIPRGDALDAMHIARSLLTVVREAQLDARGDPVRLTASVGVAVFPSDGITPEEMLIHADLAMYDAKESGRDEVVVYSEARGSRAAVARSRLGPVEEVRAALDEDRLLLYAQPVVPIAGGPPAHHELLLRMRGANGEAVPPGAFLPAAERFGLVGELDHWVLTQALAILDRASSGGAATPVSINVAAKSLRDGGLIELIGQQIRNASLDPRLLIVEVSEAAAIADLGRVRDFAAALRRLGCRFALDDFGSGFGSFLYLKHLPFDLIKIDGEYVSSCLASRSDQLVIEAVMTVARGLGTPAVAKFAPDAESLQFLAGCGVEYSQSFLTGAPVPIEEIWAPTTAPA